MVDIIDYYIAGFAIVGLISMIALLIIDGTDGIYEEEERTYGNDDAEALKEER